MLQQIRQLYARFEARHMVTNWPAMPLLDESGAQIGQLDQITAKRGRIHVTGWAVAQEVTLLAPNAGVESQSAPTNAKEMRFELSRLFLGDGPAQLSLQRGSALHHYSLPIATAAQLRLQKLSLYPKFAAAMLTILPALFRWQFKRDLQARAAIKTAMGLDLAPMYTPVLPQDLFSETPNTAPADTKITLVLPVYNAFELLQVSLQRLVAHTDLPWHLILVEDASTDRNVRPFLRDWIKTHKDRVTLIENPKNLGFIASVNRAFPVALQRGDPVILVNSDAFVPSGWASRLITPLINSKDVASVTPMSNNAEILSVPEMGKVTVLDDGDADRIDETAATLNPERAQAVLPTGIGFCMAMDIEYLRKLPSFDTSFGPGYGEEVDWCQRARALGGRHIGLASLFVEHKGGASFGDAQKHALVTKNNTIICARYPNYDSDVQAFLRDDPMAAPRLALAIANLAVHAQKSVPIYLAHSMGGGAEMDLQRRIKTDGGAIVLRVGGARRWQIVLHDNDALIHAQTDDFALIQQLLNPITQRRIVYSNGVGDRDLIDLPRLLLDLKRNQNDQIDVLFHDFLPLSPSFTLLDNKGVFRGTPDASDANPAHTTRRPDGRTTTLPEWREAWSALINAAHRLEVFSHDSAAHVTKAYPNAAGKIEVKPHAPIVATTPVTRKNGSQTIGILGNISAPKGAQIVVNLGKHLAQSGRAKIVVIGNIDPNFAVPKGVKVHGGYDSQDITALAERYGITDWLIPSVWPETFSFTTHETLATGLPVWCFDIGAQGEVVRSAPNGHAIALTPGQDPTEATIKALAL